MAMLNGGQLDPQMFAQMMQQYRGSQANPFTRQIPGSEYLGGMQGGGQQGGFGPVEQSANNDMQMPATDFAGTPPGLPNLPDNLEGFGYGQTAPQMNVNNNLRQNLIDMLMSQMGGF